MDERAIKMFKLPFVLNKNVSFEDELAKVLLTIWKQVWDRFNKKQLNKIVSSNLYKLNIGLYLIPIPGKELFWFCTGLSDLNNDLRISFSRPEDLDCIFHEKLNDLKINEVIKLLQNSLEKNKKFGKDKVFSLPWMDKGIFNLLTEYFDKLKEVEKINPDNIVSDLNEKDVLKKIFDLLEPLNWDFGANEILIQNYYQKVNGLIEKSEKNASLLKIICLLNMIKDKMENAEADARIKNQLKEKENILENEYMKEMHQLKQKHTNYLDQLQHVDKYFNVPIMANRLEPLEELERLPYFMGDVMVYKGTTDVPVDLDVELPNAKHELLQEMVSDSNINIRKLTENYHQKRRILYNDYNNKLRTLWGIYIKNARNLINQERIKEYNMKQLKTYTASLISFRKQAYSFNVEVIRKILSHSLSSGLVKTNNDKNKVILFLLPFYLLKLNYDSSSEYLVHFPGNIESSPGKKHFFSLKKYPPVASLTVFDNLRDNLEKKLNENGLDENFKPINISEIQASKNKLDALVSEKWCSKKRIDFITERMYKFK
ncbi:MAG: hypothetical protein K8S16_08400 [Bacteroidales bacterium]|nr:hypothetical protein [Bacteroidales bacterium]